MNERKLTVSFGNGDSLPGNEQLAIITQAAELTWAQFAEILTTTPPESEDKASRGWYCPAEFSGSRRHGGQLLNRHALTLDYDVIAPADLKMIQAALTAFEYVIYTTWSHKSESPRVRIVLPLSRPVSPDEFCAVSRKLASYANIELAARESHKPAQMMFLPTRKPASKFFAKLHAGKWINVDEILASYEDWTDRTSWPKHSVADEQYATDEKPPHPTTKPGIIGEFNTVFDIPTAIQRFDLPYTKTDNPNRYTYTDGSRPEGAIYYETDAKFHSHHNSDVANGQHSAYDLVRLHKFGDLDRDHAGAGIGELPSTKAMADFARTLPEIAASQAMSEFEILPPQETSADEVASEHKHKFPVIPAAEFAVGNPLAWIVKSVLPRAELVVLYGESGAGKSFLALDLCASVSRGVEWQELRTVPGRVIYVCAEGAGGFRNRLNAYARKHEIELNVLPSVVPGAPNLLEVSDVLDLTRSIVEKGKADLVVIDTLAATTAGANENSGEDMGKVLSHCKSMHKATGALVVLIHHSGKDVAKGARGWSGLKAAADAEIEVTRKGDYRTVTITKMKDGADGKQWVFKLRPVVLGVDSDGDEISSCTVEFVDPSECAPKAAAAESLIGRPKVVLAMARDIEAEKGDVFVSDLLDAVVKQMPHDKGAKRDFRRKYAKDAMQTLIDRQFLFSLGEDRVSTTSAVSATNEEFDKATT